MVLLFESSFIAGWGMAKGKTTAFLQRLRLKLQPKRSGALTGSGVLTGFAFLFIYISISAMNQTVFPLFDPIFTFARDICITVNALALIMLGFAAYRLPWTLTPKSFVAITMAILGASCIALPLALGLHQMALLVIAALLIGIGRAGVMMLAGLALSRLTMRGAGLCVCAATIGQFLFSLVMPFVVPLLGVALFLALPIAAALLVLPSGYGALSLSHGEESPHDLATIQPSSFLPPFSKLFVCLFLFHFAFGYALRFDASYDFLAANAFGVIPVVCVALYLVFSLNDFPADGLVRLTAVFVVAGYFFTAGRSLGFGSTGVALLSAGSALFDIPSWIALAAIAARNPLGAITAIAWGRGLSSFGSVLGAGAGMTASNIISDNEQLVFLLSGVLLVIFTYYTLYLFRTFTFKGTIEGIYPVTEKTVNTARAQIDENCRSLAERFGLTPREGEVLLLIAHGCNREQIEKELVVTRNTVKAHVKHIYAKLQIHSHGELLEMIESPTG